MKWEYVHDYAKCVHCQCLRPMAAVVNSLGGIVCIDTAWCLEQAKRNHAGKLVDVIVAQRKGDKR